MNKDTYLLQLKHIVLTILPYKSGVNIIFKNIFWTKIIYILVKFQKNLFC